jgi:stage V sporulation protein G
MAMNPNITAQKPNITAQKLQDNNAKTKEFVMAQVHLLENPNTNVKAFASVTISDIVKIFNVRVVDGQNGLFVSLPSRQINANKPEEKPQYMPYCSPQSELVRQSINNAVLSAYHEAVNAKEAAQGQDYEQDFER